ncbi:MAG: glycosyltransferase family 4 protein [Verrucomicrobiae bacterium]|nr:glycosyltransferase family 4 protein [Verrucomicrobiae bacterium]
MKIAITIEDLSPHRGGAEVYTLWLVRRLMAAGHDVTVFAERCGYPDLKSVAVPVRGIGRAWRALSFARNACRLLHTDRFDVTVDMGRSFGGQLYMTHNGCYPSARQANLRAESSSAIYWLRSTLGALSLRERLYDYIERERARRGARIIALSRFVADDWRRFYGVPSSRVHVIYNGVDTARFRPSLPKPVAGPLTILCVAQNFRRKGIHCLLQAAQVLRQRAPGPFRVRIVGLGYASGPGYERLSRALGVADCVEFAGETDDITKVYAAADVFCLPTFYDPCSLVVLEALACGLPVVTTRHNGAGELITPGQEGYIIEDPRDVPALADALIKLFDAPTRARMGAAARALAERHTSERNFEELLAVFRHVAGEAR